MQTEDLGDKVMTDGTKSGLAYAGNPDHTESRKAKEPDTDTADGMLCKREAFFESSVCSCLLTQK